MAARAKPASIDQYIAACRPEIRSVLKKLRATIRNAAPAEAKGIISYRMPAYTLHGTLVYFAAFKNHVGLYPPIKGNARLAAAAAKYAGPKGNLKFPLDQAIPYPLVAKIVRFRAKQNLAKAKLKQRK